MKIAVIGAGIIGVTTAYELACDGHDVTVFERRTAVAEESSFANGGIVAQSDLGAWPEAGLPTQIFRQLFTSSPAFKVGWPLSERELTWMWRRHRASQSEARHGHRAHLQSLAIYSHQRLQQLTADLKLEFERSNGYLVLLRTEQESQTLQAHVQQLRDAGVTFKELNATDARTIEPALNPDTAFFGALYRPDDEVGNCRQFAHLLKNEAQRLGVKFVFNTNVTQVKPGNGVTLQLQGEEKPLHFESAVLCAGLDSLRFLDPLGLKIPLVGVYGYSITASLREPLNAPRSAVMDAHYKVDIARLGNRIRVAGGAELGGTPEQKNAGLLQTLYKVLHTWFPGAAHLSGGVQEWKGVRPTLPDGPPILGASGIAGVWLNLGHGPSGWAQSCGSARLLADQIANRAPDLDCQGFDVKRLAI